MLYFRLNKVKILNNREKGTIFNKDRAEVKLFSFVTNDNTDLPELASMNFSSGEEDRRRIIKATVEHCVSARTFVEIRHVKDNQILYFGDTGYVVYQSDFIPNDFNWIFLGIESDKGSREFGDFIDDTVQNDNFRKFSRDIFPSLREKTSLNPATNAAYIAVTYIATVIANRLKKNKDDLIGLLYMSLNRREHYPHGYRQKDNVPDLTNNMYVDYILFAYEDGGKVINYCHGSA